MNVEIVLTVIIFLQLAHMAYREQQHLRHIKHLEARLQGPNTLPAAAVDQAPTKQKDIIAEAQNLTSVELDVAANMPQATDAMRKAGMRFGPNGPTITK